MVASLVLSYVDMLWHQSLTFLGIVQRLLAFGVEEALESWQHWCEWERCVGLHTRTVSKRGKLGGTIKPTWTWIYSVGW